MVLTPTASAASAQPCQSASTLSRHSPCTLLLQALQLNLFNACVIFLKRFNSAVAVAGSGDALHGVIGTGEGRDVRHLVLDGCLTDGALDSSSPKCGARK